MEQEGEKPTCEATCGTFWQGYAWKRMNLWFVLNSLIKENA